MFLQKYDFAANYVPGKNIIRSDILSRAPLKEQSPETSETEVNCQVHSFSNENTTLAKKA